MRQRTYEQTIADCHSAFDCIVRREGYTTEYLRNLSLEECIELSNEICCFLDIHRKHFDDHITMFVIKWAQTSFVDNEDFKGEYL